MTGPSRPSPDAPMPLERYGLAPRRHRLGVTNGAPALVKERLETFAAAFLCDPRPGLVFEYDPLVFANDAARGLLGAVPTAATDEFLSRLKASLNRGTQMSFELPEATATALMSPVLGPLSTVQHGQRSFAPVVSQRLCPPASSRFESFGSSANGATKRAFWSSPASPSPQPGIRLYQMLAVLPVKPAVERKILR
jgi:hypothetical protein